MSTPQSRLERRFLICTLYGVAMLTGAEAAAGSSRPNFVFFLVDDLGWGAMGAYGHPYHETPRFDELCSRGMRFTEAYSACTVCSPSRAAILTGQYPARLHLTDWIPGHERPNSKLHIPDWRRYVERGLTTLPEALRESGYKTAFLGKWHLMPIYREWSPARAQPEQARHTPELHGFDVNVGGREWGQPKGPNRYFAPYDMPGLEHAPDGEYLTDRLADEAVRLIGGFGNDPFLLYLSYYTVHGPIIAKQEDIQHFRKKLSALRNPPKDIKYAATYAAMHKSLDESVGRVIDKLDELGLSDNTVIVFTGDNGGNHNDSCGGLRGRKGTAFEGGVREPTCVVWPGVTEPGSVCSTPIIGTDFYPTMLEMAGLNAKPDQHVDGRSIVPVLKQHGGLDRESLYWHYPHYHRTLPYGAVRRGDWKLIEYFEDGRLMLFDLANDPLEEHDLATERPELAQELLSQLKAWRTQVGAQMPTARLEAGRR